MLISDLFEQESRWQAFRRGFDQELARRYVPDIEFAKSTPAVKSQPAPAAVTTTQPRPVQRTTVAPAPVTPTQTQPQPTATTSAPVPPAAPQPAAKPRVLAQPIRVGNKIYRPGDAMHARLSQMMQAQGRT
jgi:septum formation inhibitor MinC